MPGMPGMPGRDGNVGAGLLRVKFRSLSNAYSANKDQFDYGSVNIPFDHQLGTDKTFIGFEDNVVKNNLYAGMDYNQNFAEALEIVISKLLNSVSAANNAGISTAQTLMNVIRDIGAYVGDVVEQGRANVILTSDILDKFILSKEQDVLLDLVSLLDTMFFLRFNLIKEIYSILNSVKDMQNIDRVQDALSPIVNVGASIYVQVYGNTITSLQGLKAEIEKKAK
ncbi:hypothetical protein X966_p0120 (plasmid) [Borrelia parkeri HR1]|nr:hypothetical protein X966_p0120 [Borrelia parkeri HR1]